MLTLLLSNILALVYLIPTVKANVRIVGVEVGDWVKRDFVFSWTGTPLPVYEDLKNIESTMHEVTAISGTEITTDGTVHYKNGTETTTSFWWDVDPSNIYLNNFYQYIGADLKAGDILYPSSGWSGKINDTEILTYAGAPREVNHFNGTVTQYSSYSYIDFLWDKETGILVEGYLEQHLLAAPTESITISLVTVQTNIWTATCISAEVNVNPKSLDLRSKGNWVTGYIELPEGYDVGDVDVSTILLNDEVPAETSKVCGKKLMVRFDRSKVIALLPPAGEAELTITGTFFVGTMFEGSDTLRVR